MPKILDKGIKADFLLKYAENQGRFVKTCHELDVERRTMRLWRKEDSSFDDELNKIDQQVNELVEASLLDLALNEEKPNVVAKIFWLKNNWKEKYGDRQVMELEPSALWFERTEGGLNLEQKPHDLPLLKEGE